jgi:hypothetical protein
MTRRTSFPINIVGQISSDEEAYDIHNAVKLFIIEHRIRELASIARGEHPRLNKEALALVFEL